VSAISSSPDEPEPLSLMPGPAVTLSRWLPDIRMLFVSPPGQSAIRSQPVAPFDVNGTSAVVKPAWFSWPWM